jgi:hypothetical protein
VSKDTFLRRGLDQKREVEAEVGWRAGRRVDHYIKKCEDQRGRCRARNIRREDIDSGRRMVGRLSCDKLAAPWKSRLAAVIGIRRRALALLAAICRLLVELPPREAVERAHEQKDCQNGDGDVQATAHLLHNNIS